MPALAGRVVLLADDNLTSRTAMARVLTHWGATVLAAEGGREALSLLDAGMGVPDVVIVDQEMQPMDGFELCGEIRRRAAGRELPVLMLGPVTGRQSARCEALGTAGYLTKPVNWRALSTAIGQCLEGAAAIPGVRG
jgi:CheY-like chemotaxis protein